MLTIFNRKELIITMDMNRQADVRQILSQNEISYIVKTTNFLGSRAMGSSRGHAGSFGINSDYAYEYKIYVHRKDYDRAKWLIG